MPVIRPIQCIACSRYGTFESIRFCYNIIRHDTAVWPSAYPQPVRIDHQIIKALTQTLEILERGGKKIILTDQPFSKTDPLTEKIQQTLDTCQYKRDIIVPDDYQSYTLQEKKQVIEMLLARANFLARRLNFKGKEYLKYIITQLENIDKKLSSELFLD